MKLTASSLFALGIAAASMALDAPSAQAQVNVFGNQTDYDNATGAQIFLIDFNGNPAGGTFVNGNSFSGEVTFGSPEADDPTQVVWNSDAITDAGSTDYEPTHVGPINGVFTTPVRAFALVFLSAGEAETIHLFDEDGNLIDSVPAPNATGFFGVVSATPIKSFHIEHGLFPDSGLRDRYFIDDFRANEPVADFGDLHAAVCDLIDALDPAADMTHPSVEVNEDRKNALENRCDAVGNALAAGDFEDAIDQLLSMRAKADGVGANDWVQGAAAEALVDAIDALVAAIEAEIGE